MPMHLWKLQALPEMPDFRNSLPHNSIANLVEKED